MQSNYIGGYNCLKPLLLKNVCRFTYYIYYVVFSMEHQTLRRLRVQYNKLCND